MLHDVLHDVLHESDDGLPSQCVCTRMASLTGLEQSRRKPVSCSVLIPVQWETRQLSPGQ